MRPLLIVLAVAVLAAALAVGWWLGARGRGPAPSPSPSAVVAVPTVDPSLTFADLAARIRPDADGDVSVSVSEQELTVAANNDLPAGAPVEQVQLRLAEPAGEPQVRFAAEVADSGIDVRGTLALALVDGRVEPELSDVRAGPFPVPGALLGPVEDVVAEAEAFFAAASERGVEVATIDVDADRLLVEGRVDPAATGSPGPAATTAAGGG